MLYIDVNCVTHLHFKILHMFSQGFQTIDDYYIASLYFLRQVVENANLVPCINKYKYSNVEKKIQHRIYSFCLKIHCIIFLFQNRFLIFLFIDFSILKYTKIINFTDQKVYP